MIQPKEFINEQDRAGGLRMIVLQRVTSTAMFSVVNSGFLAAYALALGASNFQIGLLAALPFLMQPFQIPAVVLVEKLRLRKLIALTTWFPAQVVWFALGLIPLAVEVPSGGAVALLMGLMVLRSFLTSFVGASWNVWIRDVVPRAGMATFFSRQLAYSTVASIIFGLAGAFFVDYWQGTHAVHEAIFGYSFVLIFGSVFLGMTSVAAMARVPEPRMLKADGAQSSIRATLSAPLRDKNFTHLMRFLMFWGFAAGMAVPFFAVYMLTQLKLSLTVVISLMVVSQIFSVLFLRVWGPMADRFSYKAVLSTAVSLYLLVIIMWTFVAMPEPHVFTIPLLVLLHVFAGIAMGGMSLGVETIGMKLAPDRQTTAYLVGVSLATSIGAGLGPLVGGRLADFFALRELNVTFRWLDPARAVELPAFSLAGYDFLFVLSFLIGLVTLRFLGALQEQGQVSRNTVLEAMFDQTKEISRSLNIAPGLGIMTRAPMLVKQVPGVNVAASVAVLQLVTSARDAVSAVRRGKHAALSTSERVGRVITETVDFADDVKDHVLEVAKHATRGAMHAVDEAGESTGELARASVVGVIRAVDKGKADVRKALYGTGYGTVQGASEAGANVSDAARHAIKGARQSSHELDVSEQEAVKLAAQGAMAASQSLPQETANQVKEALLEEMVEREPSEEKKIRYTNKSKRI